MWDFRWSRSPAARSQVSGSCTMRWRRGDWLPSETQSMAICPFLGCLAPQLRRNRVSQQNWPFEKTQLSWSERPDLNRWGECFSRQPWINHGFFYHRSLQWPALATSTTRCYQFLVVWLCHLLMAPSWCFNIRVMAFNGVLVPFDRQVPVKGVKHFRKGIEWKLTTPRDSDQDIWFAKCEPAIWSMMLASRWWTFRRPT